MAYIHVSRILKANSNFASQFELCIRLEILELDAPSGQFRGLADRRNK